MPINVDLRVLGLCVVKEANSGGYKVVVAAKPLEYQGTLFEIPTHNFYIVVPKNKIDRRSSTKKLLNSARTLCGFSIFRVSHRSRVQLSAPTEVPTVFDPNSDPLKQKVCLGDLGMEVLQVVGENAADPNRTWHDSENALLVLPAPSVGPVTWKVGWVDQLAVFDFPKISQKLDVADSFIWRGGYGGSVTLFFHEHQAHTAKLVLRSSESFEIRACSEPEVISEKDPFDYCHGLERLSKPGQQWDENNRPKQVSISRTIGSASCPPVCG